MDEEIPQPSPITPVKDTTVGWKGFLALMVLSIGLLWSILFFFPPKFSSQNTPPPNNEFSSITDYIDVILIFSVFFVIIAPFWLRKVEKRLAAGQPVFKWLFVFNVLLPIVIYVGGNLLLLMLAMGGGEGGLILVFTLLYGAIIVPISTLIFSALPSAVYVSIYGKRRLFKIAMLVSILVLVGIWTFSLLSYYTCNFNGNMYCASNEITEKAIKTDDVGVCDKLPEFVRNRHTAPECRDSYYYNKFNGPSYMDWTVCQAISSPDLENSCILKIAERVGDPLLCEKLPEDDRYGYNKSDCYLKFAVTTKDESLCENVSMKRENYYQLNRDNCYSSVANAKNDLTR